MLPTFALQKFDLGLGDGYVSFFMGKFVVYAFCRDDGTFYYIGKGSLKRAFSKRRHGVNPPADRSKVLILHSGLDEQTAFEYEKALIAFYGRKDIGTGVLRNMTDGGEGVAGWIPSKEWREKKSRSMSGENNPFYGKQHTTATKKAISIKNKGVGRGARNPMYGVRLCGQLNPMYGRERPDLAERNRQNPSCQGTKWYTDGSRDIRCKPGSEPQGFCPGRSNVKKNGDS